MQPEGGPCQLLLFRGDLVEGKVGPSFFYDCVGRWKMCCAKTLAFPTESWLQREGGPRQLLSLWGTWLNSGISFNLKDYSLMLQFDNFSCYNLIMLQSIMFRPPQGKFGRWEMENVSSMWSVYHIQWMFQSIMIMIYMVQEMFDILCAMLTLCFLFTVGCGRARVHPWCRIRRSGMDSSLSCALLQIPVSV